MSFFASNINPRKHCFFDRHGGVSKDIFDSLNFNFKSTDSFENIKTNLEIAARYHGLTGSQLAVLHQGVSNSAVYITKATHFKIQADGMVTDKPDLILGITTADCAPVLFADTKHGVIGISHAGWRGALHGIMENTISLMLEKGAVFKDIAAAIGPCLQQQSFEIQNDMLNEFATQNPSNTQFFTRKASEHYLFDMEQFLRQRLLSAGIENITLSGIDTYTDTNYFSYRRCCHQKLITQPGNFPIQLSTITL